MFICPSDRIPLFTNYPAGPLIMSYWTCYWSVPPPGKAISCCTALADPSNPQRSSCSLSPSHYQSIDRSRKVSLTIAKNRWDFSKDWLILLLGVDGFNGVSLLILPVIMIRITFIGQCEQIQGILLRFFCLHCTQSPITNNKNNIIHF